MLSDDLGGEEQNPFTGLQYLRARYYAPQNGGFITQDSFAGTLATGLSQNRYAYALNNPVNYTDPSGNVPAWMRDKNGNPLKRDPFTTQPAAAAGSGAQGGQGGSSASKAKSSGKTPYTAPPAKPNPAPNYQKPAYAGGAAKAAQEAKRWGTASNPAASLLMQTVADPYLALRDATGQQLLPSAVVQQGVQAAKAHVRQSCNSNAGRISGVTRSEAGWKIVDGTLRMIIGGTEIAVAVSAPSPLSLPTAAVGAGNVAYGFSDVFEGINVLAGNGSVNPGRDLLFGGDQKKWNAAGTVLDVSGLVLLGGATGWGKALQAGATGAPEVLRSIIAQYLKLFASVTVGGAAGTYVEDTVTDAMDENWGRGAGLITRFGVGGLTYGGLSYLDQSFNLSGVYGAEAINPTVQRVAETQRIPTQGIGYNSFGALKKAIGSPGAGNQWHHIVEQSQIGRSGFTPQQVHNTANIVAVDASTHIQISRYYSSIQYFTNGTTTRNWLTGQSFQQQYDFGIAILKQFGVS